jgi:MFS family permease
MEATQSRPNFFSNALSFLTRQQRDWKITVVRNSMDRFSHQMLYPYLSIYIVALGASATQLGLVNSIGMIAAGLLGLFTGWLIDRIGPKAIYLAGIGMVGISSLVYGLSQNWVIAIAAMAIYALGNAMSHASCATICGVCLENKDRATGMMICETVAAGIVGMIAPMIGVWLVTRFAAGGAITAASIRPVFFFAMAVSVAAFFVVMALISNRKLHSGQRRGFSFSGDTLEIFKEGKYLKRWLVISSVQALPFMMIFPFTQVFADKVKLATPWVLGAIVTASALSSIIFAVPLGRLADKFGRKKALYITIPLFWLSNAMLVWSPNIAVLIFAGMLQGFCWIGGPISASMERELVPAKNMGRWVGILMLCRSLTGALFVFLAGLIWDNIGPEWVFITYILIDALIRMPLMIRMPETLGFRLGKQNAEAAVK